MSYLRKNAINICIQYDICRSSFWEVGDRLFLNKEILFYS